MSLSSYVRDVDRRFGWSFVGVLLALMFGGITIEREFLSEPGPHLRFDILTSTPVLDVHEEISKLSVLFDGIDIRQQKQSLRVITVRVVNDSQNDILKGYYDQAEPLGVRVSTGEIIRCDLVTASSPYLTRQVVPQKQNRVSVVFPSVIIESQEFFVVKLLVLHAEGSTPAIGPIGKVAGIRTIPVAEAYKQEAVPPFLFRAFSGAALVQLVRLPAYSLGLVVAAVLIVAPIAYVSERAGKRKRRKVVGTFKEATPHELPDGADFFFSLYIDGRRNQLPRILSGISKTKLIQAAHRRYAKAGERGVMRAYASHDPLEGRLLSDYQFHVVWMREYLESGLVKTTSSGITVGQQSKPFLEEFLAYIDEKDPQQRTDPSKTSITVADSGEAIPI